MSLAFGLRASELPDDRRPVWGARLIWPNDLVWDRQDFDHDSPDERGPHQELRSWLNGGALKQALVLAGVSAQTGLLHPSDDQTITLYEDETGVIRGNPQGSHGYLYVAGWLK